LLELEALTLQAVETTLANQFYNEEYVAHLEADRDKVLGFADQRLREVERDVSNLQKEYDEQSASILDVSGPVRATLIALMNKKHEALQELRAILFNLRAEADRASKLLIADLEQANTIRESIKRFPGDAPFRIEDGHGGNTFEAIRKILKAVTITDHGVTQDIKFTFRLTREVHEIPPVERVVAFDNVILKRRHVTDEMRRQETRDLVETFDGRITDEEFDSLPHLRGLPIGPNTFIRDTIDALLAADALEVKPYSLMNAWGYGNIRGGRPHHFWSTGDIDGLEEHLRKFRGSEFSISRIEGARVGRDERARLIAFNHPIMLLAICDPLSGQQKLSEDQWRAIRAFYPMTRSETSRERLDGYFALVRAGFPFTLASRLGFIPRHLQEMRFSAGSARSRKVVQRLLELEGFFMPEGYTLPNMIMRGAVGSQKADPQFMTRLRAQFSKGVKHVPGPQKVIGNVVIDYGDMVASDLDGNRISARPQVMKLLMHLADRPGQLVTYNEIHDVVVGRTARTCRANILGIIRKAREILSTAVPGVRGIICNIRGEGVMLTVTPKGL
jgi:hypothetical protein